MITCDLHIRKGRTSEPLIDSEGDELQYLFPSDPHNGDEMTVEGTTYTVQRAWEKGQLIIKLRKQGVVLC